MLGHFTQRTGKYAIKGYPHKLGLLLHGPPGTGKTSLIKALAHHTKRSIVNVPLARIRTNQELMDIMFDQKYSVLGEEVPIKLAFKDVIFVMEDVDAASKIVQRVRQGAGQGALGFAPRPLSPSPSPSPPLHLVEPTEAPKGRLAGPGLHSHPLPAPHASPPRVACPLPPAPPPFTRSATGAGR